VDAWRATRRGELADDLVGAMLGAAEDQRARPSCLQIHAQQRAFSAWLTSDGLLDALDVSPSGHRTLRPGWSIASAIRDRLRHCCREEQGLALGRDQSDDPLQRMDEAEVEHLVGLVEDEDFKLAQREGALIDKVEQAAGRGDEHVEAALDRAHALAVGTPPKITPTDSFMLRP
jgi:hypothetical protein